MRKADDLGLGTTAFEKRQDLEQGVHGLSNINEENVKVSCASEQFIQVVGDFPKTNSQLRLARI